MKGKLFEFNPESKDWHERGIGILKLNKSKVDEKFRISKSKLIVLDVNDFISNAI